MTMTQHEPNCPRLQFWDGGEWEAPCLCESEETLKPFTEPEE